MTTIGHVVWLSTKAIREDDVVRAAYDDIAEWYENDFLALQRSANTEAGYADSLGIDQALVELLGPGEGVCLEVGCGTGIYADRLASLGWTPVGIDISSGMLRYASDRLPVVHGDGLQMPFASGSFPAVVTVMTHTDTPDYQSMLREIDRVLTPGGLFVHVGVHPCFCGAFADRAERPKVLIQPGYLDSGWTPALGPEQGQLGRDGQVRDKVGAGHLSLTDLFNLITESGFSVVRIAEGGEPTPITLSVRTTTDAA
jgi:ubiquinone/menaquinone biosynthesis C-methylase UbiE